MANGVKREGSNIDNITSIKDHLCNKQNLWTKGIILGTNSETKHACNLL